jgi:hypothetical protein
VPSDYDRKQTLVNAERYTTPELKGVRNKVLGAEERILELEISIFNEIRSRSPSKCAASSPFHSHWLCSMYSLHWLKSLHSETMCDQICTTAMSSHVTAAVIR